jgi:DNA-binding winged helix-turn-helix (wHTH) protein
MASPQSAPSRGLVGEDLETSHWEDARHWMAIYGDLIRFKAGLLDRVQRELPKMHPDARAAAAKDVGIIETQMQGYQRRLDLWAQRLWQLHGLALDLASSTIQYRGRETKLTRREFQLLQFLLDHPHRYFTAAQLLARAWSEPALFPEEIRNYVRRLRKLLATLEVPCQLVNHPGRGYSLVIAAEARSNSPEAPPGPAGIPPPAL